MIEEHQSERYIYSKKRKSHPKRFVALVLTITLISVLIVRSRQKPQNQPNSQPVSQTVTQLLKSKKNPEKLTAEIESTVGTVWKNYSVYVIDMNSDFISGTGERVVYTGASINKLPILAALYYKNQVGEIDFNTIITLQKDDIQDYGTGVIRYDPPGTTYSIKTLARLMMEKSDNTAAYILARQVMSMDDIQKLIGSWGMNQTDMEQNLTSNADMGLLFEKIYKEKIANHALTLEMLSFMKKSDFEDRIPALLPTHTTIYHKTGNGAGSVHDIGIVQTDKTAYYIGILTSDIVNEMEATKTAALVSKKVFDFMN